MEAYTLNCYFSFENYAEMILPSQISNQQNHLLSLICLTTQVVSHYIMFNPAYKLVSNRLEKNSATVMLNKFIMLATRFSSLCFIQTWTHLHL